MLRIFLFCFLSFSVQAQQQSLLWEISGNGLKKSSYLFGTMHVQQLSYFDQSGRLDVAMKKCNVYTMELDPEAMNNPALLFQVIMKNNGSLKTMMSKDCYSNLDSMFKKHLGFPLNIFDKIIPIFTYMMIQEKMLFKDDESDLASEAMDLWLANKAKKMKLKVSGLEEVNEQLDAINSISYQEQANYICIDIHDSTSGIQSQKLIEFYKQENLDSMMVYMEDLKMPPALTEALIFKRNINMFIRMQERMSKKPHFFAVGAAHLGGDKGILQLLKKAGFTVKPIFKPTAAN